MLKFIQTECNMWFEYSACSLLVAVSELDRQIVVSFEGTQQQDQLYEQFFIAALTGLMETSVGGEVREREVTKFHSHTLLCAVTG